MSRTTCEAWQAYPWRFLSGSSVVYIRGEAYLPLARFAELQAAGEDVATARNTAAGDLRRKSGAQSLAAGGVTRAQAHGITFLAYSIEGWDLIERLPTQPDVDACLGAWGFTVPEYRLASDGPAADEQFDEPATETGRAIADLLEQRSRRGFRHGRPRAQGGQSRLAAPPWRVRKDPPLGHRL